MAPIEFTIDFSSRASESVSLKIIRSPCSHPSTHLQPPGILGIIGGDMLTSVASSHLKPPGEDASLLTIIGEDMDGPGESSMVYMLMSGEFSSTRDFLAGGRRWVLAVNQIFTQIILPAFQLNITSIYISC